MPAAVETMAYSYRDVSDLPWHKLGEPVDGYATDEQMLTASGTDWDVQLRPVYTVDGTGNFIEIPRRKATVRVTDDTAYEVVSNDYTVFQNRELFEFGTVFSDTTGAKWETAGSLRGGRVVWAMFRLSETDLLLPGGDSIESRVLLTNTHDATAPMTISVVKVRVVCMNTLRMALNTAQSTYKIHHLGDMRGKIAEAREALGVSLAYDAAFQTEVEKLLDKTVSDDQFTRIVEHELLPATAKEKLQGRLRPSLVEARQQIAAWARSTQTVDDSYRGTAWGRLQAVTEWAQWTRPLHKSKDVSEAEQRFASVLSPTGPAARIELKAHQALLSI